mgnify:FL=1
MAKKKEFFEELVSGDLFEDVSDVFGDDVVSEAGGDESVQEVVEDKYPGNKTRAFRA